MTIAQASKQELAALLPALEAEFAVMKDRGLSLDLTRGKPAADQLALSDALDGILGGDFTSDSGVDVRNYGGLDGLPELRALLGGLYDLGPNETLVGGNSSLQLMYLTLDFALNTGLKGAGTAWRESGEVTFLCPSPGYDRHFAVCEHLGINMVPVPMTDSGPDMDVVENLVTADPTVRGIWCVPRFSNPTGCVYSDNTVQRMAALPRLADREFLVMWDNAYSVHALNEEAPGLASITAACREQCTLGSVMQFGSTSKITFAGAGVAFMGSSEANLAALKGHLGYQTIGPDKVNQLRHLRFLPDRASIEAHMRRHAELIGPKFECVLQVLEQQLGDTGIGEWTRPLGGYFISFDTLPGLAETVVSLAAELGVKLTPAGATYPYGRDPQDRNIRLAPTFPSLEDVKTSAEVFALCVKLASVRQLLEKS
jgi:DNA-binding transcriptional MocR family regulator